MFLMPHVTVDKYEFNRKMFSHPLDKVVR